MKIHLLLFSLGLPALVATCGDETAHPRFEEISWSEVEVLISSESAVLAGPVDIAVGPDGTVFVLDGQDARIQPVDREGTLLSPIGGEGSGPGEFDSPSALYVAGDTLWVVDGGNGRLQALTPRGSFIESLPLPPRAATSISRVGPEGRLLVATLGRDSDG